MNYAAIKMITQEMSRIAETHETEPSYIDDLRVSNMMPELMEAVTGRHYPTGLPISQAMGLICDNASVYWDRYNKTPPTDLD